MRCLPLAARSREYSDGGWLLAVCLFFLAAPAAADWGDTLRAAQGEVVYFNAWGGDAAINQYIAWAGERLRDRHGVELRHVKVTDIAEAVTRIKAEHVAGRDDDGTIDLLWINGENFAALRRADLLYGPWSGDVPNAALVDWQGNLTTQTDGMLETAGYELPWGTAALTFFYDGGRVRHVPQNVDSLQRWIGRHPGRFTYPRPPAFLGTAFLKQLLMLLVDDPLRLQRPPGDDFDRLTLPLWTWLDAAHDSMWRAGRLFPGSGPAQRELLAVGELDWMLSYNPTEASRAIRQGMLHDAVAAHYLEGGVLANSHFLAIPYNASAKEGAMVAANYLLSPAAQLRKADVQYWGDPTVLDPAALDPEHRVGLEALQRDPSYPRSPRALLPEPHPAWTAQLESAWQERYVR